MYCVCCIGFVAFLVIRTKRGVFKLLGIHYWRLQWIGFFSYLVSQFFSSFYYALLVDCWPLFTASRYFFNAERSAFPLSSRPFSNKYNTHYPRYFAAGEWDKLLSSGFFICGAV